MRQIMFAVLENGYWAQNSGSTTHFFTRSHSMKQIEFESSHRAFWTEFEQVLESKSDSTDEQLARFPHDYRAICQHLAIAKSRRYAAGLTNELNRLVQQGYQTLYSKNIKTKGVFLNFIFFGFPATLRANSSYIWASTALFLVPALLMLIACLMNDQIIYSLMDAREVRNFENMYDPSLGKLGRERQSDSDVMMFGFYIYNNIGVSFRCFATGIFLGLGSIFFVAFNGVLLGGVSGHLTSLGYNATFYPFVIGHGAFELTAIIFSGAAGLKIGYALLAPGAYTRLRALQVAASDAIKIIYGSTLMLIVAAFIEAFWSSSSTLPIEVKLGVGALLWILVMYYCFLFGRVRRAA